MPKLNSQAIKTLAKEFGASLVGIASVERFEGAPPGHGPLDLMPQAKSVIVAGVRIPDPVVDYDEYHLKMKEMDVELGVQASIENFYMQMGHYVEDMMLNTIAIKLANYLETNHGLRSLPTPNAAHTGLGHPVMTAQMGFFSQRHAAVRAGLGEFGLSGLVITPQYGPRVRYVSIITEAELEPDPLLKEKVCLRGKCGGAKGPSCQQKCGNKAISLRPGTDLDKIFIDIPVALDRPKCASMVGDKAGFGCTFIGTCMRMCPIGQKVTKKG
ncbi:MAG: 4Fe-4S binding protein [Dehalococcoidales bacterium]